MKHFSFVYFSMLLHDSEEGCSHFVLQDLLTLVELTVPCPPNPHMLFPLSFLWQSDCKDALKPFFFFSFCKAEGSSTVDWVIKMKSHPHWFILTHRCRTFELRWASTVPPTGLLSSAKLGQAFEYSWSFYDNFPLFRVRTYVNSQICTFESTWNSLPSLPKVWSALRIG